MRIRKDSVLRLAKEGAEVGMRLILSSRHPSQEIKSLLPYLHTRLVLRVSDRKDSKLLLKSEAAFRELNSGGEMFLYDKGVISHCSLSGVGLEEIMVGSYLYIVKIVFFRSLSVCATVNL